ncbi:hypothetical protein BLNAU_15486 [Blattamonas nauphoetae]|uniref:Thioredoxin domain-containing protein n=1 Tax=Blattamonas nauphoetae TaxID=2049346 RepID=A0ABQ9XAR4_9EUKA|nr:hypothetical protein BLNAU_15486 [Blattamonas nauphoetae]
MLDGKATEFLEHATKDGIINWLHEMLLPPVIFTESNEAGISYFDSRDAVVFGAFQSNSSAELRTLNTIAESLQSKVRFVASVNSSNPSTPNLYLHRKKDNVTIKFPTTNENSTDSNESSNWNEDSLRKWIHFGSVVPCEFLSTHTSETYLNWDGPVCYVCVDGRDESWTNPENSKQHSLHKMLKDYEKQNRTNTKEQKEPDTETDHMMTNLLLDRVSDRRFVQSAPNVTERLDIAQTYPAPKTLSPSAKDSNTTLLSSPLSLEGLQILQNDYFGDILFVVVDTHKHKTFPSILSLPVPLRTMPALSIEIPYNHTHWTLLPPGRKQNQTPVPREKRNTTLDTASPAPLTILNITTFIDSFLNNSLSPTIRSEPLPPPPHPTPQSDQNEDEEADQNHPAERKRRFFPDLQKRHPTKSTKIVGNTFSPLVYGSHQPKSTSSPDTPLEVDFANPTLTFSTDSEPDLFVMFYAPWCPFSRQAVGEWDELVRFFDSLSIPSPVNIAHFDCSLNDLPPHIAIEGYPTFVLFPAGRRTEPVQFEWNEDLEQGESEETAENTGNFVTALINFAQKTQKSNEKKETMLHQWVSFLEREATRKSEVTEYKKRWLQKFGEGNPRIPEKKRTP